MEFVDIAVKFSSIILNKKISPGLPFIPLQYISIHVLKEIIQTFSSFLFALCFLFVLLNYPAPCPEKGAFTENMLKTH